MRWSNTAQHSKTHIKKFIVISIILFAPVIVTDSIFVIMTRNYPWVHVSYFFFCSFVLGECRNCWPEVLNAYIFLIDVWNHMYDQSLIWLRCHWLGAKLPRAGFSIRALAIYMVSLCGNFAPFTTSNRMFVYENLFHQVWKDSHSWFLFVCGATIIDCCSCRCNDANKICTLFSTSPYIRFLALHVV